MMLDQIEKSLGIRLEYDLEEAADILRDQVTERLTLLMIIVEALGSISEAESLGLLDDMPERTYRAFRAGVPQSRGGDGRGLRLEMAWDHLVKQAREEFGRDIFARMRTQIDAIASTIAQQEQDREQPNNSVTTTAD